MFVSSAKREERMQMAMSDIVRSVSKKEIEPHVNALVLELCCNDMEGEDVEVPYVKYNLPAPRLVLQMNEELLVRTRY